MVDLDRPQIVQLPDEVRITCVLLNCYTFVIRSQFQLQEQGTLRREILPAFFSSLAIASRKEFGPVALWPERPGMASSGRGVRAPAHDAVGFVGSLRATFEDEPPIFDSADEGRAEEGSYSSDVAIDANS